jgi:hypothetical protein
MGVTRILHNVWDGYVLIGSLLACAALMSIFVILTGDKEGGSRPITSPQGVAHMETFAVANAVNAMIEDHALPKKTDSASISRALLDGEYIYRNVFRLSPDGQICDASGVPLIMTVGDHVITVQSVTYRQVSTIKY